MSDRTLGFGGGKVILVGEHAVVHGQPAIAAGVRRGVRARATLGPRDRLSIEPWGVRVEPNAAASEPLARAFDRALAFQGQRPPLEVHAEVELPPGAGLGCSAALGVAVIDAVDRYLGVRRERADLAELALSWERVFHGAPSGIDNTAAAVGGLLRFQRGSSVQVVRSRAPFYVVVAHSGESSETKVMVEAVAERCRTEPVESGRALEQIGHLVDQAEAAIRDGDLNTLGRTLDGNHRVLRTFGLSTPKVENLCEAARRAGALGAKVTGAGGGGCVIALAQDADHAIRVRDTLPVDAFVEELGHAA
ncbi:MAG: mevalonate kinase [Myxococcota bacterium]